jgi:predicted Zn-dependent protease
VGHTRTREVSDSHPLPRTRLHGYRKRQCLRDDRRDGTPHHIRMRRDMTLSHRHAEDANARGIRQTVRKGCGWKDR